LFSLAAPLLSRQPPALARPAFGPTTLGTALGSLGPRFELARRTRLAVGRGDLAVGGWRGLDVHRARGDRGARLVGHGLRSGRGAVTVRRARQDALDELGLLQPLMSLDAQTGGDRMKLRRHL